MGVHTRTLHPDFQDPWRAHCGPIGASDSIFSSARANARQGASSWRQTAKRSVVVEIHRAPSENLVKCESTDTGKIILAAAVR
jgi:hypothetical protein